MRHLTGFEAKGRRIAELVLAHPKKTVAASLVTFVAFAAGLVFSAFSTDYRIFFSAEDPQLLAFEQLERVFTKTDNVLFVVHDTRGDVFDRDTLASVQAITEAAWKLPYASRVDSLTNFRSTRAEDEDLIVESLLKTPAAKASDAELLRVREAATSEPLLVGALLSRDYATTAVNVTLRLPRKSPTEVTDTAAAARALAAEIQAAHPGLEVRACGMALMNDAFMEASIEDMSTIVPIMYAVMLLVMMLLLRSGRATAAIVAIVALASGATMGLGGWLGYPLTPVTASAPTIVLTLAVADGVHIFSSVREYLAAGYDRRNAVIESLTINFRPVVLTSVTTMIGFLCLNFAEAPPYWHLANMTSVGILFALVFSVTLLPVMLVWLDITERADAPKRYAWLDRFAVFAISAPKLSLAVAAVATAVLGLAAARLQSNDHFLQYFDHSIEFRGDAEFTMEHLSGIYTLEYAIESGEEGGISEPAYLERLEAFTGWLRAQPEVDHVYSYTDIVKRLNRDLNGGDTAFMKLPESRELASQYLVLYEMSLPFGLDLTDRVDIKKSATRVSVIAKDLSSSQMKAFKERSEHWLKRNTPQPMHALATSPVVIFSHLADRNTKSMMRGNVASLVMISLCLILALASLRLGLLSIIPNVLPIVFGYGLWSLMFSEINIVASIVGTICLGIIVDDTIHFLSKFQFKRRVEGLDARSAVIETIKNVGPALIVTTLILGCGFGVLTQSGFQMNQYLGLMTVMVVGFALVADLLILPPLLVALEGRRRPAETYTNEFSPSAHGARGVL
ncbi:MAG: MMPL family transporter [Deltaproteobacteria bacterium]|jgi:predicted RND superfamily exporter protein